MGLERGESAFHCAGYPFFTISIVDLQIRDRLPHLKAVVQYKGQIKEDHKDEPNVYDVSSASHCTFLARVLL